MNLEFRIKYVLVCAFLIPLFFILYSLFSALAVAQSTTACSGADPYSVSVKTNQGLLTVADSGLVSSQFSFNDKCITSNRALIPQFGIPPYADLKSIFYDQARTISGRVDKHLSISGNATHTDIPATGSDDHLYYITGDLNIGGNISGNSLSLIFVDGNLNINSNVKDTPKRGTVFIVRGNINIAPTVTDVDAILVVYGTFCSAYQANSCPASLEAPKLTIRGSVMFLNPDTALYPRFVRSRNAVVNSEPAEELIYEPKYLAILRNIMSRTLTVWTENQ